MFLQIDLICFWIDFLKKASRKIYGAFGRNIMCAFAQINGNKMGTKFVFFFRESIKTQK